MAGRLYLCATPIGNLEDITLRTLRILEEVDVIAAEDTRNSVHLLQHFNIQKPLTSYHEFNKYDKAAVLIRRMQAGENIALITDAGTPGISDPGEELVKMCYEEGIEVTALPGACACITGLTLSGLPTRRFVFEAFLPAKKKEKAEILESLKMETRTIVLYEAPHRLVKTLYELMDALGERNISVCRELTKKHETIFRTTFTEALTYYTQNPPRGECVIVIQGMSQEEIKEKSREAWQVMSIKEHVALYEEQGVERKEAMKMAAKDRGISKRDVYQALL